MKPCCGRHQLLSINCPNKDSKLNNHYYMRSCRDRIPGHCLLSCQCSSTASSVTMGGWQRSKLGYYTCSWGTLSSLLPCGQTFSSIYIKSCMDDALLATGFQCFLPCYWDAISMGLKKNYFSFYFSYTFWNISNKFMPSLNHIFQF